MKFCPWLLKILNENKNLTSLMGHNSATNLAGNNPKTDLVSIIPYTKLDEILSIASQDIELNQNNYNGTTE